MPALKQRRDLPRRHCGEGDDGVRGPLCPPRRPGCGVASMPLTSASGYPSARDRKVAAARAACHSPPPRRVVVTTARCPRRASSARINSALISLSSATRIESRAGRSRRICRGLVGSTSPAPRRPAIAAARSGGRPARPRAAASPDTGGSAPSRLAILVPHRRREQDDAVCGMGRCGQREGFGLGRRDGGVDQDRVPRRSGSSARRLRHRTACRSARPSAGDVVRPARLRCSAAPPASPIVRRDRGCRRAAACRLVAVALAGQGIANENVEPCRRRCRARCARPCGGRCAR